MESPKGLAMEGSSVIKYICITIWYKEENDEE